MEIEVGAIGAEDNATFSEEGDFCVNVVDGGQVALPLTEPRDELTALRERLPDAAVMYAHPDHAAEFEG